MRLVDAEVALIGAATVDVDELRRVKRQRVAAFWFALSTWGALAESPTV